MTETSGSDADITTSDIAWDLSTLLTGASAGSPTELVGRIEAIDIELPGEVVFKAGHQGAPA